MRFQPRFLIAAILAFCFVQAVPARPAVREVFEGHTPRWLQPRWQMVETDVADFFGPLEPSRVNIAARGNVGKIDLVLPSENRLQVHPAGLRALCRAVWTAVISDDSAANEVAAESEPLLLFEAVAAVEPSAPLPHWEKVPSHFELSAELAAVMADLPPAPPAELEDESDDSDDDSYDFDSEEDEGDDLGFEDVDEDLIETPDDGESIRAFGRSIISGMNAAMQ